MPILLKRVDIQSNKKIVKNKEGIKWIQILKAH